jgi:hypothetical protein
MNAPAVQITFIFDEYFFSMGRGFRHCLGFNDPVAAGRIHQGRDSTIPNRHGDAHGVLLLFPIGYRDPDLRVKNYPNQ